MNPVEALGAVGWTYKSVLRRFFSGSLWVPFLILLLCQALGLFFLLSFFKPWAQPVAVPLLKWVGGEASLHYPYTYQVLPVAFARLEILIGVLLASVTSGAATLLFARAFGRYETGGCWKPVLKRYPAVFAYSAILSAAIFGAFALQRVIPGEQLLTDRALRWGARLGTLAVAILIETLLVYTVAWMFLRGQSLLKAFASSIRFAGDHLLPTLLLVSIPILLKYPVSWLGGRSDLFITKFQPETVTAVLTFELILELVLSFVLVGTVTFYFLWRQEEQA